MQMTVDEKVLFAIVGPCVALFFGIVGKIVWEWLRGRTRGNELHCPDHEKCSDRIGACEVCMRLIQTEQATQQTLFEERTGTILSELSKGEKRFSAISSDISQIKQSVAGLMAIIPSKEV